MVSRRKVSGPPAGPVCPVVSGTRPVVVGIPPVVGTAVVSDRVEEVATVVVGTGRVVEESTRAGPDPPQRPAKATRSAGRPRPWNAVPASSTSRPLHRLSAGPAIVAAMMKLQAPERDVPAGPAVLRLPPAALLVVAGVPGAGKTTLLSRIDAPGSLVLDPEPIRVRYQRLLGRTPYRLWRPLVHAEHFLRMVALPGPFGLIVHDTGTRGWRRRLLVGLARRCGRTGHLLLLDVPAKVALEGQRRRRRTLPRSAFATHWRIGTSSAPSSPPPTRPRRGLDLDSAPRPPGRQPPPAGRHPPPLTPWAARRTPGRSATPTSPTSAAGAGWSRASSSPGWTSPPAPCWLDVGCGTGALSETIARRGRPGAVVGIDPSAGFLAYARAQRRPDRARVRGRRRPRAAAGATRRSTPWSRAWC